MSDLTHIDEKGRARMVDVSGKAETARFATAGARVNMEPATLDKILADESPKGAVLSVARTAAIMAAKQTPNLIPLCHQLALSSVEVKFTKAGAGALDIEATVRLNARTGAEMEAMTAVSIAGLTVYDMCKAVDRAMVITDVRLLEKAGGKSGHFVRRQSA
jgi:cyclic pyranopterin phosphate synthase